ncbi:DUF805 domain-containing protein [Algibacillus agarilyticus]|uniref:DUF805 domain-containing protein n=1 Tax=Algibacillus agarilyticus TaxID=2234133 RepID=UPI000DD0030A|nr:DUF805 domain-containing protein [Algibacillus agarilyticus]
MDNQIINDKPIAVNKCQKIIYGRSDFFWGMVLIWIALPIFASLIMLYFGIDLGGIEKKVKLYESGNIAKGFQFNFFSVWYLQIPLHIYLCFKRVSDMGLNKWFTALFCIPVIHLALLVWPSKKI